MLTSRTNSCAVIPERSRGFLLTPSPALPPLHRVLAQLGWGELSLHLPSLHSQGMFVETQSHLPTGSISHWNCPPGGSGTEHQEFSCPKFQSLCPVVGNERSNTEAAAGKDIPDQMPAIYFHVYLQFVKESS